MSTPSFRTYLRPLLASLLPVAACVLQTLFWPVIRPFVWFLFYPVVFFSSWLGGFRAGLAATGLSVGLVWWFFMEPAHVLVKPRPGTYLNALLFLGMGFLFSWFHRRLREARNRAAEAESRAKDELLDRTSRLAQVGGWEFQVPSFQGSWTEEVARIHDLDPAAQPSVEMGLRYYHPEDRPLIAEAVGRAVEEGIPYDLELRLVTAKGVAKWIRTQGWPLREDGRVVKVQGTLQDITARKEAERGMRESEARYRSIFEQAGVGVVEVEAATGRFLRANDKFCEILGYASTEILGLGFREVLHPEERAEGFPASHAELRFLHRDGSTVWAALTSRPLGGADAASPHLVSVVEDITQRRRAEAEILSLNATLEQRVRERTQELQAANQELESFAYAVSHDLRAPLRAMGGFSQALQEDCCASLDAAGMDYLDQIILASRRMGGLIDGLLQLSRSTRGEMERVPVDLSTLAGTLLGDLARGEPERTVAWTVAPGIRARGDARMLEAVLGNLLGNAWKYTSRVPGARIAVDATREEGVDWLRVSDNGCGFDMAYSSKLFQPFQRLHRQDEFPGLGIGLATVHRIVQRHGGRMKALSAPGKGASFLVTLPSLEYPEAP